MHNFGFERGDAVTMSERVTNGLLLHFSMETVMYLNLRIGRESMNHQVLTGDLLSEGGLNNAARFRNDDYSGPMATTMTDYRHVPLMDQEDPPTVGYKVDEIA